MRTINNVYFIAEEIKAQEAWFIESDVNSKWEIGDSILVVSAQHLRV